MPAFSKNVVANYLANFYSSALGILIVPLYVDSLGIESFALVGFFALFQAWFNLIDAGLSGALARQASCLLAGVVSFTSFKRLLFFINLALAALGLLVVVLAVSGADYFVDWWFNLETLDPVSVSSALILMALIAALRLISSIYRSVLSGLQEFIVLAGVNSFLSSCKFIGVLPAMYFFGENITVFFTFQLLIALIELVLFMVTIYLVTKNIRLRKEDAKEDVDVARVFSFALGLLGSNVLWVIVSQSDKAIVSKMLSLEQFGYYTLAAMLASGLMLLMSPLTSVLTPRLTQLVALEKERDAIDLYCDVVERFTALVFPIVTVLFCFAPLVMFVWTGDEQIVSQSGYIFRWLVLGTAFMLVGGFPYCLILAKGRIKLHVLGSVFFALMLVPTIYYFTNWFGLIGPGYAWAGVQGVFLILWVPYVHKVIAPKIHIRWMVGVLKSAFIPVLCGVFFLWLDVTVSSRWGAFLTLAFAVLFVQFMSFGFRWSVNGYKFERVQK